MDILFPSLRSEICILRQKHEQITGKLVIPNSIKDAVLHMGFWIVINLERLEITDVKIYGRIVSR